MMVAYRVLGSWPMTIRLPAVASDLNTWGPILNSYLGWPGTSR